MTATDPSLAPGLAPGSSSRLTMITFGALIASLAAGYGVLFTIVDEYRDEYGIGETSIGIMIGLGFVAGFLSQLTIAPYADRGHAKRIVVIGVLVNAFGLTLMALGTTFPLILAGRFISGIGIGAATPAIRRIVILLDPANVGRNLGRLLSIEVFGFAIGPAVSAALVADFGIPAPFLVVAAMSLIALPFVTRVDVVETVADARQRLAVDLLRIRPFAGAVVLGAVVYVMIGSFDALWAMVHDDLGTNEWVANLGITLFAVPLIVFGPIGGRLAQTLGPFRLATFGLLAGAAFMLSYGLLPSGTWIFAIAMVHAISDGLTVSSTGVAVALVVPEDRQAGAQGVLGAAQAITAGIMAVVAGAVYDHGGRAWAYGVCAVTMCTLVAIGVWLARSAWNLRRPLGTP